MTESEHTERDVEELIRITVKNGATDQDDLIDGVSTLLGIEDGMVLAVIRDLIHRNYISYNLEWDIVADERRDW